MRYDIKDWSPGDFFELTAWFGERWRREFPAFSLLTCKWRPEDLIPGLSDLDTRAICVEDPRQGKDIGPEDWARLDEIAYRSHLEIACARPEWARKLEHLPGVCSTRSELLDDALFQPEMREWDYYWGDRELFNTIRGFVQNRPWQSTDEYYFLAKRFVPWCTPYNREIDPPINIPTPLLPKYALHSRLMHYFVPCVKAALAVINRGTVTGKRESLYRWAQLYPNERVLREAIDMLELHYEVPWLEDESEWHAFEDRLWQFIQRIVPEVLRAVTIVDLGNDLSMDNLRRKLRQYPGEPLMTLYNGVRFSRIRAGRWRFYLDAPAFFDTRQLWVWEIQWLRSTFTASSFAAYSQLKWDERDVPLDEILERMTPAILDRREAGIVKRVFAAAEGTPSTADAGQRLRPIVAVYPDYYRILERMLADARTVRPSS